MKSYNTDYFQVSFLSSKLQFLSPVQSDRSVIRTKASGNMKIRVLNAQRFPSVSSLEATLHEMGKVKPAAQPHLYLDSASLRQSVHCCLNCPLLVSECVPAGQHTSLTLGTFRVALPNRLAQQLNRELTDLNTQSPSSPLPNLWSSHKQNH